MMEHGSRKETDLCVIGAGMTGVSVARHAAEAGRGVVLLEARIIGSGATGNSTNHVMTGSLPSPAAMTELVGAGETRRLQRWSHSSKLALRRRWFDLGLGHTIRDGYLLTGSEPQHHNELEGIAGYWREQLGINDVRVLVGNDLAKHIRSPVTSCALYDPSAFVINPAGLTEGLRRLTEHAGIRVHEHARVIELVPPVLIFCRVILRR
jgi:gamma-glutamylputrescine oxidase